eukprot:7052993-Karenia_brevis.AAC.1
MASKPLVCPYRWHLRTHKMPVSPVYWLIKACGKKSSSGFQNQKGQMGPDRHECETSRYRSYY